MSIFQRYKIKRVLLAVMWVVVSSGILVLLAAAVRTQDKKLCKGLEVSIHGVSNNFFIDKVDVKKVITSYAGDNITSIEIEGFNLKSIEAELKREVWIKNADLYFDNNQVLQASVEEREPIARIFNNSGNSFYIDNTCMMLPLSDKLSARLPVFTGFPSDTKVLSKKDSALLNDIKKLSIEIQQDSFLMAMIDQVDITPQRNFEMIPKIGDQTILFGDASNAEDKFNNLQLFYKKVMVKYGWKRYSVINLQYKGQVVGKLKGKDDVSADSLRTQQIMREIAVNAARQASDSLQTILQDNERNTTDVSMIQQSMEREDEAEDEQVTVFPKFTPVEEKPAVVEKPVNKPVVATPKKPVVVTHKPAAKPAAKPVNKAVVHPKPVVAKPVTKPVVAKPATAKPAEKPKVVMPKKNDY